MFVYLHTNFKFSSIILLSFRQGVILSPASPQNEPLKSPPRLGLTTTAFWFDKYLFPIDGDTLN